MCVPENDRMKRAGLAESRHLREQQRELEERIARLIIERQRLERELEDLEAEWTSPIGPDP